jgi:hypothetical protein
MLQIVDMVSSFYLKDLSLYYSYGRLYRQYTYGWEGNKVAIKGGVTSKRQSKPQMCYLEIGALVNLVDLHHLFNKLLCEISNFLLSPSPCPKMPHDYCGVLMRLHADPGRFLGYN